ncbi:uroporphyrin-3 C-methyltransferase [Comamonas sp. BIGb0124]|uniref:uroporphyrinogen-III C-methyltransferase n=1 Tax=Comamonas sp. BIGb0124 TaxID=2485130 RepID=UPI000F4820F5|nr:uroporphyrinogen-III C-methyltransferase [Comamonas sp. BIGb0124]ROR25785.1 uroporphyrin-3 C-methyltransferase [Comamonas sp. BIGb0124]
MQDQPEVRPLTPAAAAAPVADAYGADRLPPAGGLRMPGWLMALLVLLAAAGLIVGALLWQRIGQLQSDVARRSADSNTHAIEARTLSQQAQSLSMDNSTRLGMLENQLKDLSLQRAQLETLVNQLTRSQDGNLVVEINASVRLAQQQMELTGTTEPLLAAMRRARTRLEQAALPQLGGLQRALSADIERLQAADYVDAVGIQSSMDEVLRLVEDMPLLNGVVAMGRPLGTQPLSGLEGEDTQWRRWWRAVWDDTRQLVRVTRIDRPESALIAPDQAYFLRESLKLRLLHARVDLAARQYGQARGELQAITALIARYFDPASRTTQQVATVLQQIQSDVRDVQMPRIDDTLTALAAATHP